MTYDAGGDAYPLSPIRFSSEIFYNTKSFTTDRDFGYVVGVSTGPAVKSQDKGSWQLYYLWTEIQQESVLTAVTQDDFHYANDFRGHILGAQTFLFDRADLNTWLLIDRPMSQPPGTEYEWRLRIDLTVRF